MARSKGHTNPLAPRSCQR